MGETGNVRKFESLLTGNKTDVLDFLKKGADAANDVGEPVGFVEQADSFEVADNFLKNIKDGKRS